MVIKSWKKRTPHRSAGLETLILDLSVSHDGGSTCKSSEISKGGHPCYLYFFMFFCTTWRVNTTSTPSFHQKFIDSTVRIGLLYHTSCIPSDALIHQSTSERLHDRKANYKLQAGWGGWWATRPCAVGTALPAQTDLINNYYHWAARQPTRDGC